MRYKSIYVLTLFNEEIGLEIEFAILTFFIYPSSYWFKKAEPKTTEWILIKPETFEKEMMYKSIYILTPFDEKNWIKYRVAILTSFINQSSGWFKKA